MVVRVRSSGSAACGKEPNDCYYSLLFYGVIAGLVLSGFLIWCICTRRKRQKSLRSAGTVAPAGFSRRDLLLEIQGKEGANICKLFTYEELQKATNNFATNMELGSGGFGTVFEGTLNDGTKVAIKKAKHDVEGHDNIKHFINEVTVLSQVNHRNLVKLLGCCLETAVPVLVYEFISNGNLLDHLRRNSVEVPVEVDGSPDNTFYPSSTRLPFDWNNRLKVAIGTAEALTYLHSGTSPPIYHRGVKTANILLDENYNAKVADFGLAKLLSLGATHLPTAVPVEVPVEVDGGPDNIFYPCSTRLPFHWNNRLNVAIGTAEALTYLHSGTSPPIYHRGVKTANILLDENYNAKVADFGLAKLLSLGATHLPTAVPGYLDPDYFDTFQVTDKSDVYRFGVVLLKLITAEKPVDLSQNPGYRNLSLHCNRLMKHGRFEDIIDPVLGASSDLKMLAIIHSVAMIAMKCVEKYTYDRPSMREVLEELKSFTRPA